MRISDWSSDVCSSDLQAIEGARDPWEKLERACATLLEIQLAPDSLTMPMMNDFREVPEDVRQQLIARRDAFEDQFKSLVAELPLPSGINRSSYPNRLLSMPNAVGALYTAGHPTPGDSNSDL